jgi:hypothetical protein
MPSFKILGSYVTVTKYTPSSTMILVTLKCDFPNSKVIYHYHLEMRLKFLSRVKNIIDIMEK